ncbi:MAG: general secretion pathway protein GspB [Mariprofundaceae bacterium]
MSYILDALKKSDNEARKGQLPSIHSQHTDAGEMLPRPAWQAMLIGVLSIALLIVAGMQIFSTYVFSPQDKHALLTMAQPATQSITQSTVQPLAAPMIAPTVQPNPAVRTDSTMPKVMPPPEEHPAYAKPVEQAQTENVKTMHTPPQAISIPMASEPASRSQMPPLRSELAVSVQQALPEIQISGHIFDQKPQARMVFINGRIQRQGDSISPQLRLVSITAAGVAFDFRGTAFRIDIFRGQRSR